ncbi:mitochondrial complex I protein Fmp36 [Thermoascus aurantiacus ATCC 26904]
MASQAPVSARSAYRALLRATRIAFRDDYRVLYAARAEARRRFEENRREGVDTPMHIQHALETAHILRHNIVQGVRDADKPDAQWELRIHDEIERGDNDSIRKKGKKAEAEQTQCCSSQQ